MYCEEQTAQRTTYQLPDESKDELAIRLRIEGKTFREIGAAMDVDAAMAHRRVKRAMMRRRCEMEDRMEDIRDLEFEKLRVAERALMPQVAEGDQGAIRLLVRIIETRRRYLKDLPYKNIDEDPWAELMDDTDAGGAEADDPFKEDAPDADEVEPAAATDEPDAADKELQSQRGMVKGMRFMLENEIEPGTKREQFARAMLEVEEQKLVALEREASTKASTTPSTHGPTKASTKRSTRPVNASKAKSRRSKVEGFDAKAQRKKKGGRKCAA